MPSTAFATVPTLAAVLLLLQFGAVAAGPAPPPHAPEPQDVPPEAAVLSAIEQVFDGMRAGDAERVREVLAADVRFALLDPSGAEVSVQSMDEFLQALDGSGGNWDEQIYDVEVRVDAHVASVWAPFTFYLDGAVSHCGTNSMELLRDSSGWKITQISDTRRTEGCPDPLGANRQDP